MHTIFRLILQYSQDFFLWFLFSGLVLTVPVLFSRNRKNWRIYIKILLAAYMIGVCSQTIFPKVDLVHQMEPPYKWYLDFYFTGNFNQSTNLIPFRSILQALADALSSERAGDYIRGAAVFIPGNILLFLPLGILLPIAAPKHRTLTYVIVFSLTFAVLLEIVQFFIGKAVDIDDVILRVSGSAIGYGLYALVRSRAKEIRFKR